MTRSPAQNMEGPPALSFGTGTLDGGAARAHIHKYYVHAIFAPVFQNLVSRFGLNLDGQAVGRALAIRPTQYIRTTLKTKVNPPKI